MTTSRRLTFDPDAMRSFVLGIELGSFTKAADKLGRSTSAISAQLKKLEEQAGSPLVQKVGRHLVLTESGETMMAYAKRILDLNDEAAMALRDTSLEGWIRLGLQEDFGELMLATVLSHFSRAHPRVKMEARVARNAELTEGVHANRLDMALIWGPEDPSTHADRVAEVPMCWVGAPAEVPPPEKQRPLSLVAFEPPCLFRQAGTTALDRNGIAWRSGFLSSNLGGLWAAVSAGLGLTVRTPIGLPPRVRALEPARVALPALPTVQVTMLRSTATLAPAAARLAQIVSQAVAEEVRTTVPSAST